MTANILAEGQVVQLDLGAKTQVLPCRVLGFGGSNVVLAPVIPPPESTLEAMAAGRAAYVIVDRGGGLHALRAQIHQKSGAEEIVVSVTDGFQLGQRRRHSRAPLALRARLRPLGGGEAWETVTCDISAGGVRVARTGAPGEDGDALAVVLEAAEAGLHVDAETAVVRRTAQDISLRFTDIDAESAGLLHQIAVAYYRLLVRRD